jgi:hypothetical protein
MLTFEGNCVSLFGQLLEVTHHAGGKYIPLRSLCDVFGMNTKSQTRRVSRHAWAHVAMLPGLTEGGQRRPQVHLEVGRIPMWLFTIQDTRLSPESREKVQRFQMECMKALESSPRMVKATEDLVRDLLS